MSTSLDQIFVKLVFEISTKCFMFSLVCNTSNSNLSETFCSHSEMPNQKLEVRASIVRQGQATHTYGEGTVFLW